MHRKTLPIEPLGDGAADTVVEGDWQSGDRTEQLRQCDACGQSYGAGHVFCGFDGTRLRDGTERPRASGDMLVGCAIEGRYEVEEKLGEGGMGSVYRVKHRALGRRFAIKVLHEDLAQNKQLAERFTQEATAIGRITHVHVVDITDFGTLPDGRPFYVMELLSGESLAKRIAREGSMPAPRVAEIGAQIADGLEAAHAAGIVHRDLKPDNVFLVGPADRATVKVLDFGAALVMGARRMTQTGVVFGTPHYMSPEQASGAPVDHRADVYALGILLYEALAGRVPFESDTFMGVITQHMFAQPPPLIDVAPIVSDGDAVRARVGSVVMRALAKTPAARFPDMASFGAALRGAVGPVGEEWGIAAPARRDLDGARRGESRGGIWSAGEAVERFERIRRIRRLAIGAAGALVATFLALTAVRALRRPPADGGALRPVALPPTTPAPDPPDVQATVAGVATLPSSVAGASPSASPSQVPSASTVPTGSGGAGARVRPILPKSVRPGINSDFKDPWGGSSRAK